MLSCSKNTEIFLNKLCYCFIFINIGFQSTFFILDLFSTKTNSFCLIYLPRITTIDSWHVNLAVWWFLGTLIMWLYSYLTSFYSALIVKLFSPILEWKQCSNFMEHKTQVTHALSLGTTCVSAKVARKNKSTIQTLQRTILCKTQEINLLRVLFTC